MLGFSKDKIILFCAFCGVYYSCFYSIMYVRDLREQMAFLQTSVEDLKQMMVTTTRRVERGEARDKKLFNLVDPWESCLRFNYYMDCDKRKSAEDPPCSAEILKEMLILIVKALEEAQVNYWVSYGTLLGAVRNQTIIPWTADIDFVIKGEEYKNLGNIFAKSNLEEMGYKFFYDKKYPDIGRVCITERNTKYLKYEKFLPEKADYYNAYPYADLYQTSTKEKNSVVVMYGPQCRFSMDTVYPLTRIKLYDLEVKAPHNYTQYLTQLYGPKFMDPPPNNLRTGHGAYSEACKNG